MTRVHILCMAGCQANSLPHCGVFMGNHPGKSALLILLNQGVTHQGKQSLFLVYEVDHWHWFTFSYGTK